MSIAGQSTIGLGGFISKIQPHLRHSAPPCVHMHMHTYTHYTWESLSCAAKGAIEGDRRENGPWGTNNHEESIILCGVVLGLNKASVTCPPPPPPPPLCSSYPSYLLPTTTTRLTIKCFLSSTSHQQTSDSFFWPDFYFLCEQMNKSFVGKRVKSNILDSEIVLWIHKIQRWSKNKLNADTVWKLTGLGWTHWLIRKISDRQNSAICWISSFFSPILIFTFHFYWFAEWQAHASRKMKTYQTHRHWMSNSGGTFRTSKTLK